MSSQSSRGEAATKAEPKPFEILQEELKRHRGKANKIEETLLLLSNLGVSNYKSLLTKRDRANIAYDKMILLENEQERMPKLKFGEVPGAQSRFPTEGDGARLWRYVMNVCQATLDRTNDLNELRCALNNASPAHNEDEVKGGTLSEEQQAWLKNSRYLRATAYGLLAQELQNLSIDIPDFSYRKRVFDRLPDLGNGKPPSASATTKHTSLAESGESATDRSDTQHSVGSSSMQAVAARVREEQMRLRNNWPGAMKDDYLGF